MSLFAKDGRRLASFPEPDSSLLGREFRFREYYECIEALARRAAAVEAERQGSEVCVSPAYRGESIGGIMFTVAAPVYSATQGFVGFVSMSKHAKNTLEVGPSRSEPFELELYVDPVSSARTVAVVAPVARTGIGVLIATPYSAVHSQLADLAGAALRRAWVPLAIGLACWLLLLFAPNARWPWPGARRSRR